MGFSVAGAAVVVGFALVAAGTGLAATVAHRVDAVDAAQIEALERLGREARTRMDITEVKLIGLLIFERLYVIADNTGSETLDPSSMDVLVDGAFSNSLLLNWTAGGKENAENWPPASRLYMRLDIVTVPDRATLVADNGVIDVWDG